MQAWMPVVSSSLYIRKSVSSFRVDSILKWRVYIKLKVSWLRAFLWCMSQTSRDRVNSRRVRTHKKNSGDAVRRLGAHKAFFVPNQEPEFAWPFGNGPARVGTQGLFRLCLKTFVAPFLPSRLTTPGSPRMIWNLNIDFAKTSFLGADFIALDACFPTMWTGGYRGRKHSRDGDGNIAGNKVLTGETKQDS